MDLQELTEDQMQMALQLCDILSLEDLTVAAAVLASYNWDISKAIDQIGIKKEIPAQPIRQQSYQEEGDPYAGAEENQYEYPLPSQPIDIEQKKQMFQEQYASLCKLSKTISEPSRDVEKLAQLRRMVQGGNHAERERYYEMLEKGSGQMCKKILQGKQQLEGYKENQRKLQNNRAFLQYLHKKYHPLINFTFGTFFLSLTRSFLANKPLLVYIHTNQNEHITQIGSSGNAPPSLSEMLLNQPQIAKFVNKHCIAYGMFDNSDDYEIVGKYVPLKDLPAFAVFQMDRKGKGQKILGVYKIVNEGKNFLQWLAQIIGVPLKKKTATAAKVESLEVPDKMHSLKSLQKIERIKIADIRAQQDYAYFEAVEQMKMKKQISNAKHAQQAVNQKRIESHKKLVESWVLKEGQAAIDIKFRLPGSGQNKVWKFATSDKIQKMFQFVDGVCRDDFQNRYADFDLTQTYPYLSLKDKTNKLIGDIFQDSARQNIIVKELS